MPLSVGSRPVSRSKRVVFLTSRSLPGRRDLFFGRLLLYVAKYVKTKRRIRLVGFGASGLSRAVPLLYRPNTGTGFRGKCRRFGFDVHQSVSLVVFRAGSRVIRVRRLEIDLQKKAKNRPVESSILTHCPRCGHQKIETMPTTACQFFYECENCNALLKPKPGDCCVFCSYGTVKCPPIQASDKNCC